MYDILQEILMTIKILGMSADAIHGDTLCNMINQEAPENESGIGTWMVEHCLASFSEEEHCLMSFWDEDHSSMSSKNVEQIEEQTMKPGMLGMTIMRYDPLHYDARATSNTLLHGLLCFCASYRILSSFYQKGSHIHGPSFTFHNRAGRRRIQLEYAQGSALQWTNSVISNPMI
jgi:hypothetical protein